MIIFNTFFVLSDFNKKYNKTVTHRAGKATLIKSNFDHSVHNITQTVELPTLHHKIILAACENSIIQAETKDSKISNTAELHWNSNVAQNHIHIVLKILFVAFLIALFIPPDTTFLDASSKNTIHNRNNHNHHKNCAMFPNVIFCYKE